MSLGDKAGRSEPIPAGTGRAAATARQATATGLILIGAVGVAAALLPACARPAPIDPASLYAGPRARGGGERAPLVVIPGFPAVAAADATASGALPLRLGAPLRELRDDVRPAGGAPSGPPGGWNAAGAEADLLAALRLGGYRPEEGGPPKTGPADPPNLFRFDYDHRRDLVEAAASLHRFLLDRRQRIRAARRVNVAGRPAPIRFDVVALSSGGLVLRYYLRYGDADLPKDGSLPPLTWAGADLIGRAILVATPNAGAVGALLDLVGDGGAPPFLPRLPPTVLGTWPSAYQMMPRGRHASVVRIQGRSRQRVDDLFDDTLWETLGWGLSSADQDEALARLLPLEPDAVARRRVALDHLRKCLRRTRRFCEALDVPGDPPAGVSLHLMAADATPTAAVGGIDWATGRLNVIERRPGDGLVLRSSALLDERVGAAWSEALLSPIDWSSVMFFHADGAALGRDPAFIDNLLFLLLEQPRRSAG